MNIVSKYNPLAHYQWGENCEGWNVVAEKDFSVKLEKMPAHTAEMRHFHEHAQQFFYILKGEAVFEIGQSRVTVKTEHGIHIKAGAIHRIINERNEDLEFILSSC